MHNHQDARLLAEELAPSKLKPAPAVITTMHQVWQGIEHALATPGAYDDPARHICALEVPLGIMRYRQPFPRSTSYRALIASLALFGARAAKTTPSKDDMRHVATAMSGITANLLSYKPRTFKGRDDIKETDVLSKLSEFSVYHLLAESCNRTLVPYISSPREEASRNKGANHDLYALRSGRLKIPLQIRATHYHHSSNFDAGVLEIPMAIFLSRIPEFAELQTNEEHPVETLARNLVVHPRRRNAASRRLITAVSSRLTTSIQLFGQRISDDSGNRLPLDAPIPREAMMKDTDSLLDFTATDRVGTLGQPHAVTARDRTIVYDSIEAKRAAASRTIRLFNGNTEAYGVTFNERGPITQLSYVQNALLRQVISNRANKTTSWQ